MKRAAAIGRIVCRRREAQVSPRACESQLAALVRLIGHADLRWHLWIALALLGRLELALAGYAVYFALRATAGAVAEGGAVCLSRASPF